MFCVCYLVADKFQYKPENKITRKFDVSVGNCKLNYWRSE